MFCSTILVYLHHHVKVQQQSLTFSSSRSIIILVLIFGTHDDFTFSVASNKENFTNDTSLFAHGILFSLENIRYITCISRIVLRKNMI